MSQNLEIGVKLDAKELEQQMTKLKKRSAEIKKSMSSGLLNTTQMKKAKTELKSINTEMKKVSASAKKGGGGFKDLGLAAKAGALIAVAAVLKIVASIGKLIKAYDVQAKAEQKLLVALKGKVSVHKILLKQATDLQKITLFGDEQTIAAQAQLAKILGANATAIKGLTPLVQDLATLYDMDLSAAADLVGRSVGTSMNALSRYGIVIEGAVGSAERLESAMIGLNKVVGGQAAAAAEVGSAKFKQLSNAWGDLVEIGGKFLTKALNPMVVGLRDLISSTTTETDLVKDEQRELNALVISITKTNEGSDLRKRLIDELNKKYPGYIKLLGEEETKNENMKTTLDVVNKKYLEKIRLILLEEKLKEAGSEVKKAMDEQFEAAIKLGNAQAEYNEAVGSGIIVTNEAGEVIGELPEASAGAEGAIASTTETIKKQNKEVNNLEDNIIKLAAEYDKQTKIINNAIGSLGSFDLTGGDADGKPTGGEDPRITAEKEKWKGIKKALIIGQTKVQETEIEMAERHVENISGVVGGGGNFWDTWTDPEKQEALMAGIQASADVILMISDAITAGSKRRSEERINILEKEKEKELEILQQQLDQGIINQEQFNKKRDNLDDKYNKKVANEKGKIWKAEQKAALIDIAIKTAVATIAAWGNGPAAGVIFGPLVLGLGALQAAIVASQKMPKFQSGGQFGGLVQGPSHAAGGILTPLGELEGREFIVNQKQTNQNLPLLESINNSNGDMIAEMNKRLDKLIEVTQIPNRSFVVESDITSTQARVRQIEKNATI